MTKEPDRKYVEFIKYFKGDPRLEPFHIAEENLEDIVSSWIEVNSM